MPGAAQTALPEAEVLFTINPPSDTDPEASLSLEIVDTVTGLGFHNQRYPMDRLDSGQWEVSLTLPVGSLIRYRYWQISPNESVEHNSLGEPIRYRLANVTSSMQFVDQVTGFAPSDRNENSGRVVGQLVDADSQQPVPEMIVTVAGLQTFSDGQGRFRLEGVPVGLNNLVAYHPDGAYRTVQQGAVVAEGGTTPANFMVKAAQEVTMTFQVKVPAGTPSDQPLRLVGNLYSLGDVFTSLPGGVQISALRAPTLIAVDESNYLMLAKMYAGTDLRYKYTLGDGLWNAERTDDGAFRTRQLIIPETDAIQADVVDRWQETGDPIELNLPDPTTFPTGELIGLQFDPFTAFEPLPMKASDDGSWRFTLFSPLTFEDSLSYNLCRNMECGRAQSSQAMELDTDQAPAQTLAAPNWQWWPGQAQTPELLSDDIRPREEMQLGVDLVPQYRPTWVDFSDHMLKAVEAVGATNLTLSPSWVAEEINGAPLIRFNPARDYFQRDWLVLAQAARNKGLSLNVRPHLTTQAGDLDQWWQQGARDSAWWTTANEQLRYYLLTQAKLAEGMQASQFILDGSQLGPALPGGQLSNGQPANQPLTAETYWRELIQDLRAEFSGELVFELELEEDLSTRPAFLDAVDAVQIYWHAPLAAETDPDVESMRAEAERYLDLGILSALPEDMPVTLSLEYLSIEGSAVACPPNPSGGCRSAAEFDVGAVVDSEIQVDLNAQTEALSAVLMEVEDQPRISGVYLRRFYPLAAMQDKSASVHGKPAQQLIKYWFNGWGQQ